MWWPSRTTPAPQPPQCKLDSVAHSAKLKAWDIVCEQPSTCYDQKVGSGEPCFQGRPIWYFTNPYAFTLPLQGYVPRPFISISLSDGDSIQVLPAVSFFKRKRYWLSYRCWAILTKCLEALCSWRTFNRQRLWLNSAQVSFATGPASRPQSAKTGEGPPAETALLGEERLQKWTSPHFFCCTKDLESAASSSSRPARPWSPRTAPTSKTRTSQPHSQTPMPSSTLSKSVQMVHVYFKKKEISEAIWFVWSEYIPC